MPSQFTCADGWFGDGCNVYCGGTTSGPALPSNPSAFSVCSSRGTCRINVTGRAACDCDTDYGGIACADACPNCGYGSVCVSNATDAQGVPTTPECKCLPGWWPVFIEGPDGAIDPEDPFQGYALICWPEQLSGLYGTTGNALQRLNSRQELLAVAPPLDERWSSGHSFCPVSYPFRGAPEPAVCGGPARGECVGRLSPQGVPTDFNCSCHTSFRGEACEQSCPSFSGITCSDRGDCVQAAPPAPPTGIPTADESNATCECKGLAEGSACERLREDPYPLPSGDYSQIALIFGTLGVRKNPGFKPDSVAGDSFVAAPGSAEVALISSSARQYSTVLDPEFDLSDPAAQSFLIDLCEWLDLQPGLVLPKEPLDCWLKRFRSSVVNEPSLEWPLPRERFAPLLVAWANTHYARTYFGTDKNETRVLWARQLVRSTINFQLPGAVLTGEPWAQWQDSVLTHIRENAPPTLGSKPIQASDIWLRAFVELEFVTGTAAACGLSVAAAVITTALFVRSACLAVAAGAAVGTVLLVVLAYLVISGSTLGAIEAIAVVCLVGLSIDGALHFAHGYVHAPHWLVHAAGVHRREGPAHASVAARLASQGVRAARAAYATSKMGWAIISSNITTAGAAAFLLFTTVEILRVFGGVLVVTIATSLTVTMFGLNALLTVAGPLGEGPACAAPTFCRRGRAPDSTRASDGYAAIA